MRSPQYRREYWIYAEGMHIRTFRSSKLAYFFAGTEHKVVPKLIDLLAGTPAAPF